MQNVALYSRFYFLRSGSVMWFTHRGVELLISRTALPDCPIMTDLRPVLSIRWIIFQVGQDDPSSASPHGF